MYSVFAPASASHFRRSFATNSGPLYERRCSGTPPFAQSPPGAPSYSGSSSTGTQSSSSTNQGVHLLYSSQDSGQNNGGYGNGRMNMTTAVAKNGISHPTKSGENSGRKLQGRRIIRLKLREP
jgi:hypothetical protein